jgi:hypothetical protein
MWHQALRRLYTSLIVLIERYMQVVTVRKFNGNASKTTGWHRRERVAIRKHLASKKIVVMGGNNLYLHYLFLWHQFPLRWIDWLVVSTYGPGDPFYLTIIRHAIFIVDDETLGMNRARQGYFLLFNISIR